MAFGIDLLKLLESRWMNANAKDRLAIPTHQCWLYHTNEHKGVHSEVILDSAIKMAEDPDFLKEYDENLLCDIEEVN